MTSVFRVNKDRNYTVMSNYHLNDKNISLKAKGLLSQMLSLPDGWDYTLRGLATINKENLDAIRTAVLELEKHGYITRRQLRDGSGRITCVEYSIFEHPQPNSPRLDFPNVDNPNTVFPNMEKPVPDNPTQLNTKQANNQKENTKRAINHPINLSASQPFATSQPYDQPAMDGMDRMDEAESYRKLILRNIEYNIFVEQLGAERMDEVVELMLETILSKRKYIKIAGDEYPREVVKSRLLKVNPYHLEYVFDCLDHNTTKVRNIKSYLLTALFNAPATMDSYYRAEVNHDLYGSSP